MPNSNAPSPLSLIDIAVRRKQPPTDNLASSVAGSVFLFLDAAWHAESDDAPNQRWMDDALARLEQYEKGALINETDWTHRPDRLTKCFAPEARARLQAIVRRHDPTGLFVNPLSGISS